MLFDKRFSLKTVYYRSFLLLIVIPILLVSVISLTLTRYIMERSAITNIRNAQASIESSLSKAIRDISLQLSHLVYVNDGEVMELASGMDSGDQQQRVAIARALITKPAIVLADEPTGNLDSKTSSDVIGLLKRTSVEFHQTIVMITHNDDIARLADRIIRIEDGKITGGMEL